MKRLSPAILVTMVGIALAVLTAVGSFVTIVLPGKAALKAAQGDLAAANAQKQMKVEASNLYKQREAQLERVIDRLSLFDLRGVQNPTSVLSYRTNLGLLALTQIFARHHVQLQNMSPADGAAMTAMATASAPDASRAPGLPGAAASAPGGTAAATSSANVQHVTFNFTASGLYEDLTAAFQGLRELPPTVQVEAYDVKYTGTQGPRAQMSAKLAVTFNFLAGAGQTVQRPMSPPNLPFGLDQREQVEDLLRPGQGGRGSGPDARAALDTTMKATGSATGSAYPGKPGAVSVAPGAPAGPDGNPGKHAAALDRWLAWLCPPAEAADVGPSLELAHRGFRVVGAAHVNRQVRGWQGGSWVVELPGLHVARASSLSLPFAPSVTAARLEPAPEGARLVVAAQPGTPLHVVAVGNDLGVAWNRHAASSAVTATPAAAPLAAKGSHPVPTERTAAASGSPTTHPGGKAKGSQVVLHLDARAPQPPAKTHPLIANAHLPLYGLPVDVGVALGRAEPFVPLAGPVTAATASLPVAQSFQLRGIMLGRGVPLALLDGGGTDVLRLHPGSDLPGGHGQVVAIGADFVLVRGTAGRLEKLTLAKDEVPVVATSGAASSSLPSTGTTLPIPTPGSAAAAIGSGAAAGTGALPAPGR